VWSGTLRHGRTVLHNGGLLHAPDREISVFDYVQIIFATIFGILFFGELPDGWSFLGYAFIGVASLAMFLMKKREVVE
jgi:drug/metabolite transporter (DMT)-like permease